MSTIQQLPLKPEHAEVLLAFALKMKSLGISASFNKVEEGPVVTGFYFTPSGATPLNKFLKHEEDFALAAKVDSVTVSRIAGNIIIFVPNKERKVIDFKDSCYYAYTKRHEYQVPISVGVDHLGNKTILDLTDQPHILLAGQTGSGKSVFLANVIATLAVCKTRHDLVFSFIDTKRLDLPLFSELPHVVEVAKDVSEAYKLFENVLGECRLRYKNLESKRVRSIKEWNVRFPENYYHYHVVIIDELSDLLDQDKEYRSVHEEQEQSIPFYLKQLVQISRAAGIHIIAGTQRPSAKILSGDIKNNFPCRIGMKMPTYHDSTTILGDSGAETLLGKGDMLVKQEGSDILSRYHGPMVRMQDIEAIVHNLEMVKQSMEMIK